ncbi:ABC transporter ATP-binding protein [Collinsella sp. zg1085]|uniref:ABC transporter ATP-binding protein n=1 Tax=Collinsella sp. zg1085 TaxID=2844380 RepID=UPI001C0CB4A0|nr:ABC transporter ATP-binding protein [Collinsella sp. zg1085]QWT17686.1 ABC transporter ATP-binding protein [Collinsella sp. zg1085]
MSENEVIEATHISKRYMRRQVLSDVTLTVPEGEVRALIGENGAGKSTFIRIVCGIATATSGTLSLFGQTGSRKLRLARRYLGFVPDTSGAYQDMSALQNLKVRCTEWGIPTTEAMPALKLVGLGDTGKTHVGKFSMGMKRRLDIATALLGDTKLIVMDEPINGLDPLGIIEMRDIIHTLHHKEGKTILLSSHNLNELEKSATSFSFMKKGSIIGYAESKEIAQMPAQTLVIKSFRIGAVTDLLHAHYKDIRCFSVEENTLYIEGMLPNSGEIAELLSQQQIPFHEIYCKKPSLEDYYKVMVQSAEQACLSA